MIDFLLVSSLMWGYFYIVNEEEGPFSSLINNKNLNDEFIKISISIRADFPVSGMCYCSKLGFV
jgi:hypothetical protein